MNQQSLTFVGFSLAAFVFAACGDDPKTSGGSVEDQEIIAISDKTISGVSQKGPFVNGSSVTVQELDGETFAQTGDSYEGKIKNDLGEFSVKVAKLASQYALLKANGFYRNEVTGEKSKSQVTLYALTDLSDRDEVNVNLLTHLAYERSLYLATGKDSLSVSDAKKQAEAEVLKTFGIEGDFAAAEDLNIFGENDQSAALLAVSVLMQGNLSEGDFSERLANYAADIESDGIWNDSRTATKIADWANSQGLGSGLLKIRENITKWDLSADVPSFEKYVNNFWWQNYGLGTCDKRRESEVLKNQNSASANAGEYYICKSNSWQEASDLEKDTYKWATGKDAEVKYGDVVKENCYVFEDKAWRSGNASDCSLGLRGCTTLRQDAVGKGSDKEWYTCDSKSWREAIDIEKDTATWGAGSFDGEIRAGQVNKIIYYIYETSKNAWRNATALEYDTYQKECSGDGSIIDGRITSENKYVCDGGVFRSATENDVRAALGCTNYTEGMFKILSGQYSYYKCESSVWNFTTERLNQGSMTDDRDGHVYKTIGIKKQMWMAENLNYTDSINYPSMNAKNFCLDDKDSCAKYGRYYTWAAAIDSVYWSKQGKKCGYDEEACGLPEIIKGICPSGWRLPNENDWIELYASVNNDYKTLQSKKNNKWKRATDEYGFSAIPAAYADVELYVDDNNEYYKYFITTTGEYAFFWSATEIDGDVYSAFSLIIYADNVGFSALKRYGASVRCLKD